jgi:hypothetical protein
VAILPRVLTILTIPKPFVGHIGNIQRNALESWKELRDDVQIVLIGDEPGIEDVAHGMGVQHVGGIETSERGTPRLDSAFSVAETVARFPLWALINSDIVLLEDFLPAVDRVARTFKNFVLVGECRDLKVAEGARLSDATVREQLRGQALQEGRLRGYAALDYFVFPRGLFDPLPPFLIGRAGFDNWLVWRARKRRHPVVDATRRVVAIHQSHDYSHVAGGQKETYDGEEARYNLRLAGARNNPFIKNDALFSLDDATHRLYRRGRPVPYLGSVLRIRARVRFTGWLVYEHGALFPLLHTVYLLRKRLGLLDLRERWFGGRFARS